MPALEAETVLRAAVALGASDPVTQVNLGQSLLAQARYAEAEELFEAAVRANPDLAAAHYFRGAAISDGGDPESAQRHFCRAASLQPENATFAAECEE